MVGQKGPHNHYSVIHVRHENGEVLFTPVIVCFCAIVEESGASDAEDQGWSAEEEWLAGQTAPLNLLVARSGAQTLHLVLGDLVLALLQRGRFTVSLPSIMFQIN